MYSRKSKYRKSFENYEQAIQKHLTDDFLVHQYLTQNKLTGQNMEEYSKLFNSLSVTKNEKRKKYDSLRVNYDQMTSELNDSCLERSTIQFLAQNKNNFAEEYDQIMVKTSTEFEVKNTLWKEIIQVKKSLNLLKGDIGHLIGRNESAKMLESKISKVKIVADDQLKRVSLAFGKDKDELKLRGDMQKKFTKKLKNVSMYENSTLKRFKKSYVDTMVKKKEIHDRLNYIEKVSASINETGQKQRMKNQKNERILDLYNCFIKLINLISKIPEAQAIFLSGPQEIHSFVNWLRNNEYTKRSDSETSKHNSLVKKQVTTQQVNSPDLNFITQENLSRFQQMIIHEHGKIMEQIEKKTSEYDLQMKKSEQMIAKLDSYREQIQTLENDFYNEASMQYALTAQMKEQDSRKLKSLSSILKTIFSLLEYVQKNLNYTNSSAQIHRKSSQSSSQYFVCKESTKSNKKSSFQTFNLRVTPTQQEKASEPNSLIWLTKNYISELYKSYCVLLKQDESNDKLQGMSTLVYDHLQNDIEHWLRVIKESVLGGKLLRLPLPSQLFNKDESLNKPHRQTSKMMRDSIFSVIISPKTAKQIEEEQIHEVAQEVEFNRAAYLNHHTMYDDLAHRQSYASSSNSSNSRRQTNTGHSVNRTSQKTNKKPKANLINYKKLKHCNTQQNFEEAQRIQLLQNVDKDYYKMLKSTITMEKQNTRKNYLFLRTFKRAKFSSRDEILQQKRFECSFSMLFAGKENQLLKKKAENDKKSSFYKNTNLQKRLSKLIQPSKLTNSVKNIKFTESRVSFSESGMPEMKESLKKTQSSGDGSKLNKLSSRNLSIEIREIKNLV